MTLSNFTERRGEREKEEPRALTRREFLVSAEFGD